MTSKNWSGAAAKWIFWLFPKIVFAIGVFGVFVFYTWFNTHQPSTSADYAAWVQAIGSVGAILGAFYIGERQADKARSAALEQVERVHRNRVDGILAISKAARERVDTIYDIFCVDFINNIRPYAEYHPSQLESLKTAFDKVAVHELGDAAAVDAFLGMFNQFDFLADVVNKALENATIIDGKLVGKAEGEKRVIRQNIETHINVIRKNYAILQARLSRTV